MNMNTDGGSDFRRVRVLLLLCPAKSLGSFFFFPLLAIISFHFILLIILHPIDPTLHYI